MNTKNASISPRQSATRPADDIIGYLNAVLGDTPGVCHISAFSGIHRKPNGTYAHKHTTNRRFAWPADRDKAATYIEANRATADIYICPYVLQGDKRSKGTAAARAVIHADVDTTIDTETVVRLGGFAVSSGTPGHAHAYIPLTHSVTPHQHEILCRALVKTLGGDPAKVSDNDLLRPPGTINHKPTCDGLPPTPTATLIQPAGRVDPFILAAQLGVTISTPPPHGTNPENHAPQHNTVDAFQHTQFPLVRQAVAKVSNPPDRSADIHRIVAACYDSNLTLGNARWAVNLRSDLTAKLEGRTDDYIGTSWKKIAEDRATRLHEDPPSGWQTPPESVEAQQEPDEAVKTVPWPTLPCAALHGTAGRIVDMVAPHTEADPAALLVTLLAVFGATLGPDPHIIAGNERHQAVIHPLVVGRTNSGAKGTSLGVIEAIRKAALPWFDEFTTSGLSSAEGLIEAVRDKSGNEGDKDHDPGVEDKRLLVKETEYRSVLARCRREGNTLSATLRQAWDGGTLRTLTRKTNKLTATNPHIVVIGHITPRELKATLDDSDLSGGSVNRLLICLSKRSQLHTRLGNLPNNVLEDAASLFKDAQKVAQHRNQVEFSEDFWTAWDATYRVLNRDRPDSWSTDATARGVSQVLRIAMMYALFDGADTIGVPHLHAAEALWQYSERSATWLFSSHEQEAAGSESNGLVEFIADAGPSGRTRTDIYKAYFQNNSKASEVAAALAPLVHDGVIVEMRDGTGARPRIRYIHANVFNGFTDYAGQDDSVSTYGTYLGDQYVVSTDEVAAPVDDSTYEYVNYVSTETCSDLHNPFNTLIRNAETENVRTYPWPEGIPAPSQPADHTTNPRPANTTVRSTDQQNLNYQEGRCTDCGTQPPSPGRTRCHTCHTTHQRTTAGYDR